MKIASVISPRRGLTMARLKTGRFMAPQTPSPECPCAAPGAARSAPSRSKAPVHRAVGLPRDELAMAFLRPDLAVMDRHLPARQGEARQALDLLALEDVVIDGRLLRIRR
jgi:hypothetical protein